MQVSGCIHVHNYTLSDFDIITRCVSRMFVYEYVSVRKFINHNGRFCIRQLKFIHLVVFDVAK